MLKQRLLGIGVEVGVKISTPRRVERVRPARAEGKKIGVIFLGGREEEERRRKQQQQQQQ